MKLLSTIVPSLFAGALIFGSVAGNADDGRNIPPTPPTPPTAPTAPKAPKAPKPPKAPKAPKAGGGSGFNISINDGKVSIEGLDSMVDAHVNAALHHISSDPSIPPKVREKVIKRLEKIRAKVKTRVSHLDVKDTEELGEELEKLGEEIGEEMEQFGEEMEQFGKDMEHWGKDMDQWSKDFEKQFGKDFSKRWNKQWGPHGPQGQHDIDIDIDDDLPDMPDPDDVDDDAVRDLGDLSLSQPQRDQLKKLRTDSDAKVAQAKQALKRASDALEKQLENPNASDADIARSIDAVAQQEAAIRKARILAWVNARRMLDDGQRKKVEGVAKGRTK